MERICDICQNFETSPCGCTEICHAQRQGSMLIPWITDTYRDQRMNGNIKHCKGLKRLSNEYIDFMKEKGWIK